MKTWIPVSILIALVAITIPAIGLAAVTVEQRGYFYAMDVTRGVATSTFVIGDFGPSTPLRPSAKAMIAASGKSELGSSATQPSSSPVVASPVGYEIPVATGKTKRDHVSTDPDKRDFNCRVEISVASRSTRSAL